MSQAVRHQGQAPDDLKVLYAPVQSELDRVEQVLRDELTSNYPFVDNLVKHGFRMGGKRLRPALVLLSGRAVGDIGEEHLSLAAAVEIIHTATLVHDDVLDEATIRRHLDTVNARWNNEASILLGDYLFAHSFALAAAMPTMFACRDLVRTARVMCEGELRQMNSRGDYDLDEEEYVGIIGDKTAELCACCCRLGAHHSGADDDTVEKLGRYGRELGIAFQIKDDLLDVVGDEAATGKSLGTDLLKEKATLPVIRLMNQLAPANKAKLIQSFERSDNHDVRALRPWLAKTDALDYCGQKARWHANQAAEALRGMPSSPALAALHRLTDFVVNRKT